MRGKVLAIATILVAAAAVAIVLAIGFNTDSGGGFKPKGGPA